jgi:hypothetical protein
MLRKFILLSGIALVLISVLFSACYKNSDIGFDIVPSKYLFDINIDTIAVEAYTHKADPIKIKGISTGLVASYTDPIFGDVNYSIISQMRSFNAITASKKDTCNYIEMFLDYDTIYSNASNLNQEQEIGIYRINQLFYDDSSYFSNIDTTAFNSQFIGKVKFNPSTIDDEKVIIGTDTLKKVMRIKLDSLFGDFLTKWNGTSFVKYFKGFYIKSLTTNSSIVSFNLLGDNSKVLLHYNKAGKDTIATYTFSNLCTRLNRIEHDFTKGSIVTDLINPDIQKDVVYLQGGAGLDVKIKIPYLDALKDNGPWIVNRAELILQAESESQTQESKYPAPSQVFVYAADTLKLDEYKYSSSSVNYYLGTDYSINQYKIDLTHIVEKIINGKEPNKGFKIKANDHNRVVLNSGKHTKPMKLILSITKP